jgi:glycosyltransferase involved in cell wall biosynthesis
MNKIKLTYVISTFNRLPYLKRTMNILIENKKNNEEIIVADGGSIDGTKDFLALLFKNKQIDYFISEPDVGESHALNKLFLMAQGDLIRIITDDDISYYPGIEACKNFMLTHSEIDILGTDGGFKNQDPTKPVRPLLYENDYIKWQKNNTPFSFCCLGIMLRKSSLPILGLFNPNFKRCDAEFSFRITSGKINIAWSTTPSFVNISNPQSTSLVHMKKIKNETNRLNKFYLNKNPDLFIIEKLKVLKNKLLYVSFFKKRASSKGLESELIKLFEISEKWLKEMNESKGQKFMYNK